MPSRYMLPIALVSVLLAIVAACADADTIHFKNRSVLNNVKVVAQDWRGVQVQVSDTVRMSFARKDIAKIQRERLPEPHSPVRPERTGDRVPNALREKLTQSIAVNYEEPTSFVEIVNNISELYGINITMDTRVRDGIANRSIDPLWTFTKEDGSNVLQMLGKLVTDKGLTYRVSDDSILISVSEQPAAVVTQLEPRVPSPAPVMPPLIPAVRPTAPPTRRPAAPAAGRARPSSRRSGPGGRRGRPSRRQR